MLSYFGVASVVLLLSSIYVAARGLGWGRLRIFLVLAAVLIAPMCLAVFAESIVVRGQSFEVLIGIVIVAPLLVLFALCKSLANRVQRLQGQ